MAVEMSTGLASSTAYTRWRWITEARARGKSTRCTGDLEKLAVARVARLALAVGGHGALAGGGAVRRHGGCGSGESMLLDNGAVK
jgi:hypothetical protein